MAKTDPIKAPQAAEPVVPAKAPATQELPVSLNQFCTQLSQDDKRVELIGGFHYTESRAGRTKDLASAYQRRFNEFLSRPA